MKYLCSFILLCVTYVHAGTLQKRLIDKVVNADYETHSLQGQNNLGRKQVNPVHKQYKLNKETGSGSNDHVNKRQKLVNSLNEHSTLLSTLGPDTKSVNSKVELNPLVDELSKVLTGTGSILKEVIASKKSVSDDNVDKVVNSLNEHSTLQGTGDSGTKTVNSKVELNPLVAELKKTLNETGSILTGSALGSGTKMINSLVDPNKLVDNFGNVLPDIGIIVSKKSVTDGNVDKVVNSLNEHSTLQGTGDSGTKSVNSKFELNPLLTELGKTLNETGSILTGGTLGSGTKMINSQVDPNKLVDNFGTILTGPVIVSKKSVTDGNVDKVVNSLNEHSTLQGTDDSGTKSVNSKFELNPLVAELGKALNETGSILTGSTLESGTKMINSQVDSNKFVDGPEIMSKKSVSDEFDT